MWTHEETVFIALKAETTTIDDEFGTLIHARLNETFDVGLCCRGDDRAVIHILARCIWADFEFFDAGNQRFDQTIRGVFANGDCNRNCHAAFASGTVTCANQRVSCLIHIRVGHDDHVVFGTTEALNAFAIRAACCIDIFSDGGRANKANGLDCVVMQDCVNCNFVTIYHL